MLKTFLECEGLWEAWVFHWFLVQLEFLLLHVDHIARTPLQKFPGSLAVSEHCKYPINKM